jgi:hypothetical protein
VPHQVPVGFSHPRQNQFEWEQICQIRYNKLYYQIILFSPTDNPNLNSSSKTKLQNRQKQSKFAHSSKMPHIKKLKQKQQRLAKRHPLNASTGAQINHFPTFNFEILANQTFLAGPQQIAPTEARSEIPTGNELTSSRAATSAHRIQASGPPWEVTQQTSIPHGTTHADAHQYTKGNNSNGIKLGESESTSNSQVIISTVQDTGQPWKVTQQTSAQHGQLSADAQQFTEGNNYNKLN